MTILINYSRTVELCYLQVRRAPELQLHLLPQQSGDIKDAHVSVTLVVKCGAQYPHTYE